MINQASSLQTYIAEWPHIPKQAFLYFPSQNQIHSGTGKTYIRRIFEGAVKYEPFEELKINEFNKALEKQHKTLLPWFTSANRLRFLQACKFDIDKTVKSVLQNNQWRLKTFPVERSSFVQSFIQSGAIYICGRDHCFRPIIVMDLGRFDTNNSQIQKPQFLSKVLTIFFQFMISEMFIQGQVQNYVMIINLNNLNMFTIGGIAKKLLQFTNNMYRSRLYTAYILNTSSGISFFWNVAKSYLSQNTIKKVIFSDQSSSPQLFTHTNRSQIQRKFGGTLSNITSNFFPPRSYSYNYLLQNQKIQTKLISSAQYLNYFRSGMLKQRKILKQWVENVFSATQPSVKRESMGMQYFSPIREDRQSVESVARQVRAVDRPYSIRSSQASNTNKQNLPSSYMKKQKTQNNSNFDPSYKVPVSNITVASVANTPTAVSSLRRRQSLQQQMMMDLAYIGNNSLTGNNSVIDMPIGDYPVHRVLAVQTFFQETGYVKMKQSFNPYWKA